MNSFRTGTERLPQRIGFAYNAGGIGDWINWTSAIQFAIEEHPHLSGKVGAPPHFIDLARLWLSQYAPRFEVVEIRSSDFREMGDLPCRIPDANQYANTCSMPTFPLGFIYYAQTSKIPPAWKKLPEIRGDEVRLPDVFRGGLDYVVITPSAIVANKRLKAAAINELSEWLRSQNIWPVFLGKREVAPDHKGGTEEGLKTELGFDMLDRTTLPEAACIMANARAVIGLDNGLLHLAACSQVPIAWAFTTADPRWIIPPRPAGAKTLVLTPPESLECRFCHNRMLFTLGHNFRNCIYGDNLCTETYDGKTLIRAAEQVLMRG